MRERARAVSPPAGTQMARGCRLGLVLMVMAGAALIGCTPDVPAGGKRERPPVAVEVASVIRGDLQKTTGFVGELEAVEEVDLAAQAPGRVERVFVRLGDVVEAGQRLAQLDDAELRAQLLEARAVLRVAQASAERADVERSNVAVELSRKESLAKDDLVTAQELDNVRTRHAAAVSSLAVANAQVAQAEARVELLSQKIADMRINAPFGGAIAARYVDPGAVVSVGTSILRAVRNDPVVVRFQVPERLVGELLAANRTGEPIDAQVRVDAYPQRELLGRVVRVAPVLDPSTRAAQVEAELENPNKELLPGMYCRVRLRLEKAASGLLLPIRALLERPNETAGGAEGRVFVVADGRAEQKRVVLGLVEGQLAELRAGLEEGDVVVVRGQSSLREGAPVRVVGEDASFAEAGSADEKAAAQEVVETVR